MSRTPLETVEALLESVLEETQDADVHYKLRTALQLLVVARRPRQGQRDARGGRPRRGPPRARAGARYVE